MVRVAGEVNDVPLLLQQGEELVLADRMLRVGPDDLRIVEAGLALRPPERLLDGVAFLLDVRELGEAQRLAADHDVVDGAARAGADDQAALRAPRAVEQR